MDISQLLHQMDQAVVKHRKGDLLLGWRIRLWSVMKREFGKEADFRRNVLAFLVAQDTYPLWENGTLVSAIPPEDLDEYYALPGRAMDEYVRYLKGRSSRKKRWAVLVGLRHDVPCAIGQNLRRRQPPRIRVALLDGGAPRIECGHSSTPPNVHSYSPANPRVQVVQHPGRLTKTEVASPAA